MENTKISASLEDYLETIYFVYKKNNGVKAIDVAKSLGVRKSSVTDALKSLSEKKLLNYAPYQVITLTEKGEKIAKKIAARHEDLYNFLSQILGVSPTEAMENACRIEHVVSDEVMNKIVDFMEFNAHFYCKNHDFIKEFKDYSRQKN